MLLRVLFLIENNSLLSYDIFNNNFKENFFNNSKLIMFNRMKNAKKLCLETKF